MVGAMTEQRRRSHHHIGAGEEVLRHVSRGLDARGRCERAVDLSAKQADPGAWKSSLEWARELDALRDLERVGVEVGLHEAVEENERICSGFVEAMGDLAG